MALLRRFSLSLVLALLFAAVPAHGAESGPAKFSDGFARDLERLDAGDVYGAFVHFRGGSAAEQERILTERGLKTASTFASVDVVYAVGALRDFAALETLTEVTYIEANSKVELLGDTGTWATRAKFATDAVGNGPYRAENGSALSGAGVGVAVIDSGIDSTHPDLAANTAANYKVVCTTPFLVNTNTRQCFGPLAFIKEPYTDASSGHGTHVAGIVAGDGTASDGTYRGVAPGASLFGYGVGEADTILYIAEAFQHIINNYDTLIPRIRVINNSYGDPGGSAFDPKSVYSKLVDAVVAKGVTVVFAAGNDGGNGSEDSTSSFSKNPTPGVISAANYDDDNTGARDFALDDGSSRGHNGHPETYPDLSAPGSSITSTCRPTMPICDLGPTLPWAPNYSTLSGTSMASPHIAGAAALLYQARPDLTPAQVEDVLQDTAHRFSSGGAYESDPQNSGGLTSFDKGAGLVDATAALDALGVPNSGYGDSAATQTVFAGDGGEMPLPGESDIEALSVTEGADGLTYRLTFRDLDDLAPFYPSYRLFQNVDGEGFVTTITTSAKGPAAGAPSDTTNSAIATQVARDGNDIVFVLPFDSVGDPAPGSAGHNVWVASYQGVLVDSGPGGTGPEHIARPRFADYSIYRGAGDPVDPVLETTTLSFTSGSATTGQYSDEATFEVSLVDEQEAPIANETVELTFGTSTRTLTTDEAGLAATTVTLDDAPGDYLVEATYGGRSETYLASSSVAQMVVTTEDSSLSIVKTGRRGNETIEATLTDADSGAGVADRTVSVFAGDTEIGTATTNAEGVATVEVPPRYSSPRQSFSAVFEGDDYFEGSTS